MDIRANVWIGYTVILALLTIGGVTYYRSVQNLIGTVYWVTHTYEVETLLESVVTQLSDAETGQRGFLLTGKSSYLEPYQSGSSTIAVILTRLKTLTADNSKQQLNLDKVQLLIGKKLTILEETIDHYRSGRKAKAIDIILTNRGKQLMDEIRTIIDGMKFEENRLMAQRQQKLELANQTAIYVILIGTVLTFLVITAIAIMTGRNADEYLAQHKKSKDLLTYIATHDPLTGLYNRLVLEQRLNDEVLRALRYKHCLSVFMVDIDFFKMINDNYGHPVGDIVLRDLANLLEKSVRIMDYVARFGGEEFVVILPETSRHKAKELAERLRKRVDDHIFLLKGDKELKLTLSIGIATLPEHAQSPQELLKMADTSMYAAKQAGRNQVKVSMS